jgi:antitoxin ParD1/3/4
MTITLRPDQEAWLRARVADGDSASVEAAAHRLFDRVIAEEAYVEPDDMGWAKPLVEEARAAVARGEFLSLDEFEARSAALLASLKT